MAWAELARADAESIGDEHTAARARVEAASAMAGQRPRAEAGTAMDEAIDHARRVGDPVLLCRAINNCLELVAAELAGRARPAVGDDRGQPAGRLRQARRERRAAVGRRRRLPRRDLGALRRANAEGEQWWGGRESEHCWVRWCAGEHGDRGGAARRGRGAARPPGGGRTRVEAPAPTGGARPRAGRGDRRPRWRAGWRSPPLLDRDRPLDLTSSLTDVVAATEAALALGHRAGGGRGGAARRLAGRSSVGGHHPCPHRRAAARRRRRSCRARRPPSGASLADPDPTLGRPLIGSLRTTLAVSLAASGDRAGALLAVRRTLDDDLARWPGTRRDRALALARRLEGSSARPDGELTGREREVAALLAEGLTNGQLAERLFISPKTAAVHVSNILAKLGLSSRARSPRGRSATASPSRAPDEPGRVPQSGRDPHHPAIWAGS